MGQMSSSSARPRAQGHHSLRVHTAELPMRHRFAAELLRSPCARRRSLCLEPVAVTESLLCLSFPFAAQLCLGYSLPLQTKRRLPAPAWCSRSCPHRECWAGVKRAGDGACAWRAEGAVGFVGTPWCLGEVWCHLSAPCASAALVLSDAPLDSTDGPQHCCAWGGARLKKLLEPASWR